MPALAHKRVQIWGGHETGTISDQLQIEKSNAAEAIPAVSGLILALGLDGTNAIRIEGFNHLPQHPTSEAGRALDLKNLSFIYSHSRHRPVFCPLHESLGGSGLIKSCHLDCLTWSRTCLDIWIGENISQPRACQASQIRDFSRELIDMGWIAASEDSYETRPQQRVCTDGVAR